MILDSPPSSQKKLLADAMLGSLARWLRVLGFDVTYDPALDDPELVGGGVKQR